MCDGGDDYEPVTVHTNAWKRARTPHECCGCEREIGRTELYHHSTTLCDGGWTTYKHCAACWAILCHLWEKGHEQLNLELACGEEYDAPEDDPGHALAFMTVAEQQAWALQKSQQERGAEPLGSWIAN